MCLNPQQITQAKLPNTDLRGVSCHAISFTSRNLTPRVLFISDLLIPSPPSVELNLLQTSWRPQFSTSSLLNENESGDSSKKIILTHGNGLTTRALSEYPIRAVK